LLGLAVDDGVIEPGRRRPRVTSCEHERLVLLMHAERPCACRAADRRCLTRAGSKSPFSVDRVAQAADALHAVSDASVRGLREARRDPQERMSGSCFQPSRVNGMSATWRRACRWHQPRRLRARSNENTPLRGINPQTGLIASSNANSRVLSLRFPRVRVNARGGPLASVSRWCFQPVRQDRLGTDRLEPQRTKTPRGSTKHKRPRPRLSCVETSECS